MKICFYRTSGRDFETFGYKIIEEFKFKYYVVKVIEIKSLAELIEFVNKIKYELIITDTSNIIYYKKEKENYSLDTINRFLDEYSYAIEIYDCYRE